MYETGRMRRTHLRGHSNILKRLLIHAGAFNLSRLLRKLIGVGTPRGLQGRSGRIRRALLGLYRALRPLPIAFTPLHRRLVLEAVPSQATLGRMATRPSATGC